VEKTEQRMPLKRQAIAFLLVLGLSLLPRVLASIDVQCGAAHCECTCGVASASSAPLPICGVGQELCGGAFCCPEGTCQCNLGSCFCTV